MKKYFLLAALFIGTLNSYGTIRTVCNSPANVAQYNAIQDAIDASSGGDTIMVQGSLVTYPGFATNGRRITIIGPGWWPLRQGIPNNTLSARVLSSSINNSGSSGTEIQGLEFVSNSRLSIDNSANIDNIRLIRNRFSGGVGIGSNGSGKIYKGFLIEGNWFDGWYIIAEKDDTCQNFLIQNNLFVNSRIEYFVNAVNVVINHNLFYGGNVAAGYFPFLNREAESNTYSQNLTIQNNVFYNAGLTATAITPTSYSLQNCLFKNNITYNSNTTEPWSVNGNVNGRGNYNNINPQLVDGAAVLNGLNDPSKNFSVSTGAAKNSGTDGKDMGLLYDSQGSLNWNKSRMSRLPYIHNFSISDPNIGPGGAINISVEARSNN